MKKWISGMLCGIMLLVMAFGFAGCSKKVNDFTVEEHIQRISERIESSKSHWGYPEGEKYEKFEIYPLYDKNEELKYFLVEFEPYGFSLVSVKDEPPILTSCLYANKSMYSVSVDYYGIKNPWTPYVRDKNSPPLPSLIEDYSTDRTGALILDENGEMSIYEKSPYFVTGNISEKKYLLQTDIFREYICAVKKGDTFINLISGLEFEYSEKYFYDENATLVFRFLADSSTDL